MTFTQASGWKNWAGKAGALCSLLLFLFLLDTLAARFKEPPNHFSCLPGQTLAVTGPLSEKPADLRELSYESTSPDIRPVFESLQTGFWLGGTMWKGMIRVGPEIQPGTYQVAVRNIKERAGPGASRFQIAVFKDLPALHRNSPSLALRYLGIQPWAAVLFLIPLVLLTFGAVFSLAQKTEGLLAREGKAEVYRVSTGENGLQIHFGLGKKQGLQVGAGLTVLNEQGQSVGQVTVLEVFEDHALAQAGSSSFIRPGHIISMV